MTSAPTAPGVRSQAARRPFSLRELFSLTTLAATTVALIVRPGWTGEETALLSFSAGGVLLGLLACRLCRRRGGLAATLLGTLGSAIAIGLSAPTWIENVQAIGPDNQAEAAWEYAGIGTMTLLLGVAISTALVILFALQCWLLSDSDSGFVAQVRRRPVAAGVLALGLLCGIVLSINARSLLHPREWKARVRVVPWRDGKAVALGGTELSLSRDGRWLALAIDWYSCNYVSGDSDRGTWLFSLQKGVNPCQIAGLDTHEKYELAFAPDRDLIAYLKQTGNQVDELSIYDLAARTALPPLTRADEDWFDIDDIDWLPDGKLALTHGDVFGDGVSIWDVPQGVRSRRSGVEQRIRIDTRLGHAYVITADTTRVVNPTTDLHITELPSLPFAEQYAPATKVSPDQHFILGVPGLYDADGKQRIDTDRTDSHLPDWRLWTFTKTNLVVASKYQKPWAGTAIFDRWRWLNQVPLIGRYPQWIEQDQLVLLDPQTAAEVVSTQPLHGVVHDVTFSHDGAVMAAATEHGVYIYDVPPQFR